MRFKIIYILIWFCWGNFFTLQAQVEPPDFLCVKNDTLFWNIPFNDCGPFEQYTIYFSTNENGPFTVLDFTSFMSQDFYHHPNPAGNQYYYYLTSEHDCPGEFSIPSDTLNNRPPRVGAIISVSNEGTGVRIDWEASESPEANAYIIYRIEDNGTFPIDTVSNTLTYLDVGADQDLQSESYFVVALDACENSSVFGEAHNTIFLITEVSDCEQSVRLSWNPYDDWDQGVARQELWVQTGAAPVKITDLQADASEFIFEGLVDNQLYTFFIQAVQSGDEDVLSISNIVSFTADIISPITEQSIYAVQTNADNTVSIEWRWNPDAELQAYTICSSDQEGNVISQTINNPSTLAFLNTYNEGATLGAEEVYTFEIKSTDLCDSLKTSNKVSNILLQAKQINTSSNQIEWTDFMMENADFDTYELYQISQGQEFLLGTFSMSETNFVDEFDPVAAGDQSFCYYVLAKAKLSLRSGEEVEAFVRSNTVCVQKAAYVVAPNVFAPLGKNSIFKPVLFNRNSLNQYELNIWDRWGSLVFTSNDPSIGWDGTKDRRLMPKGVYPFSVKLIMNDGSESIEKGSVLLFK